MTSDGIFLLSCLALNNFRYGRITANALFVLIPLQIITKGLDLVGNRVNFRQLKHLKTEMLEHFLCAIILKFFPKLARKFKNEKRITDAKRVLETKCSHKTNDIYDWLTMLVNVVA